MKKSTKTLLIAALCMAIVGAAFCIAGLCFGFTLDQFQEAVEAGDFEISYPAGGQEKVRKLISDADTWVSDITSDEIEFEQSYTSIEALDLEVGVGECRLILWDGEEVKVTGKGLPVSFQCQKDGKELEIDCQKNSWRFWDTDSEDTVLEIYLPQDLELEYVKMETGVGSTRVEGGFLKCREFEVSCGVGECNLKLDVEKKLDLDGGVGEVFLELKGQEKDFNYEFDCGIGEVVIGSRRISEVGYEDQIHNGASREISIDNGIGNVEITFSGR